MRVSWGSTRPGSPVIRTRVSCPKRLLNELSRVGMSTDSSKDIRSLDISGRFVALLYSAFTFLIFWPVLFQRRFFWEDFFHQEYPIRDFSYYTLGLHRQLPFWNPYNWEWAPLLSD